VVRGSGCLPLEAPGQTQNSLEGLNIPAGPGTPQDPPGGAGDCCWGERCLGFPPGPVASMTRPVDKRMAMVGWINSSRGIEGDCDIKKETLTFC